MEYNYRKLLIKNIRARMKLKGYSSPEALAKDCYWQSGKKKGKRVSDRQVRYVFEDGADKPVPSADVIAAIAVALVCEIWELYFDEVTMREKLMSKVFEGAPPDKPKTPAQVDPITHRAKKITSDVE